MPKKKTEEAYLEELRGLLDPPMGAKRVSVAEIETAIEKWQTDYPEGGLRHYFQNGGTLAYRRDCLYVLLDHGLNLNETRYDQTVPYPLARAVRKSGGGELSEIEDTVALRATLICLEEKFKHEIAVEECHIKPLFHFTKEEWKFIDLGCQFPEELRLSLNVALHYSNANEYHVPLRVNENYKTIDDYLEIDPAGIPPFLATMRPEALACRILSFRLLNNEVFTAIVDAENKKRSRTGEPTLTAEQLLRRLPPFVQKNEALVEIHQAITRKEASNTTGLQTLATATRERGFVIE